MRHRLLPLCFALWLTSALIGCGGGSGGAAPTDPGQALPSPAARTTLGTVLAKVTDTSGAPVAGAVVSLVSGGSDPMSMETNASGEVQFVNIPAGRATVSAEGWGYYPSPSQDVQVVERSQVSAAVTLEPRSAAMAVVLGSRVVTKNSDGKSLEFEVDVAVLDPSGEPLTNLADAAFSLPTIDCGWGPCFVERTRWLDAWYNPGSGQPLSFGLQPARTRSPVAVGILLDQGLHMAPMEPQRSRALAEILGTLAGNDSVLLAEFSGSGGSAMFKESGGFVTDARSLLNLVQGLPDRLVDLESDPVQALESMLQYLEAQPAAHPKVLVALTRGDVACDAPNLPQTWLPSCERLAERSLAVGIPITTFSHAFSVSGADLARRTGGAAFFVDYAAQYRTALRGLLSVVGGEIPYYRLRFQVGVGAGTGVDPFAPGNTFYPTLEVQLSERDRLYVDVAVPL